MLVSDDIVCYESANLIFGGNMRQALITFLSFFMLTSACYGMNLNLQSEVLDILVEFESGELQVEDKFDSTELVYLNKWPQQVMEGFGDYLSGFDYYMDEYLTRLTYEDPSGEYGVRGKIQRSLVVTVDGEKAYIAYYLFIGGEWGREEVYHDYYVLDSLGDVVTKGTFERNYDYFELEEDFD
jgi:hypothetical protein